MAKKKQEIDFDKLEQAASQSKKATEHQREETGELKPQTTGSKRKRKVVSYTLPPDLVQSLKEEAHRQSTADQRVSASEVLESILREWQNR